MTSTPVCDPRLLWLAPEALTGLPPLHSSPMDERQTQIRERAGLEEGKLNEDFIDFLRRFGTPVLLVAAVAAGGYALKKHYNVSKTTNIDLAFQELEAARAGGNASPDTLTAIALEYEGVRAVSLLARLEAADAYLDAIRRGVKPGSEVEPDGTLKNPEDAITEDDRTSYLAKAADLYAQVQTDSARDPGKAIITLGATYGLAAVAEARTDFDAAKARYEDVIRLAETSGYDAHAAVARARIGRLGELANQPRLYSRAELPKPPAPPPPPTATPLDFPSIPGTAPGATPAIGTGGVVFPPLPTLPDLTSPDSGSLLPVTPVTPASPPAPAPEAEPSTPPAQAPATPAAPK